MKYSKEFKLMCIEMYYRGEYPETPEGQKKKRFHDTIKDWVRMSEKAGITRSESILFERSHPMTFLENRSIMTHR